VRGQEGRGRQAADHRGKRFERGVGTVAESVLNVHLDGEATTFSAQVGADDCKRGSLRTSVEFFVIGDGRLLWSSGVMRTNEAAKVCEVSVAGVKQLLLKVGDADDGNNDDFADWADAKFETTTAKTFQTSGDPVPATVAPDILTPAAPPRLASMARLFLACGPVRHSSSPFRRPATAPWSFRSRIFRLA